MATNITSSLGGIVGNVTSSITGGAGTAAGAAVGTAAGAAASAIVGGIAGEASSLIGGGLKDPKSLIGKIGKSSGIDDAILLAGDAQGVDSVEGAAALAKKIAANPPKPGELGSIAGIPSISKDKVAEIITNKAKDLALSLLPIVATMAVEAGINKIGTPDYELPDFCLPKEKFIPIIKIRDSLYDQINTVAKSVENLSRPISTLNNIVTTTSKTVVALNIARTVSLTAIELTPPTVPVPGTIITGISKLDDLVNFLNPKVTKAQITISSISLALDFANGIFSKILEFLRPINEYIEKCSGEIGNVSAPPSINEYLTKVQEDYQKAQNVSQFGSFGVYKGFILDIVQEPYSPTVNRIKAVAKNNQGIILLQTPLSFTTDAAPLVEQLKLIIDTSDLKVY